MANCELKISEKKKILDSCHRYPTSGHLGVRRTLSSITEIHVPWIGVSKDVNKMVKDYHFRIIIY